jgi:hypothetical protein
LSVCWVFPQGLFDWERLRVGALVVHRKLHRHITGHVQ